ncbi:MAG: proprotein convertase P-domain-containing protein [Gammaproteobacteria bacterium]
MLLVSTLSGRVATADENSVREYLAQQNSTAYLQQGETRIDRVAFESRTLQDAVVFQKYIQDIPLHGGHVVVFESSDGQVARVIDTSTEALKLNQNTPAIDAKTAEKRIKAAHASGSTSQLVWFRMGNEAIPAWEVTTALADSGKAAAPTGLETVIDAMTGRVLSQRQLDSKTYAPGSPEAATGVYPRIVINDAIGPAGSQAYAAPFDAVAASSVGCTGTLISENVMLSARHCGIGAGSSWTFGDDSNGGGDFSINVQSSFLPAGGGSLLDGGDVSIHVLTGPVPAAIATPVRLLDETFGLEGMVAATLGYGWNGVGSAGHGFNADGLRWGGENIIDVYGSPANNSGSNIISTDFDDGSAGANTIAGSDPEPLALEATTAPGDSGGPVMVQMEGEWLIAGVLSGGTTNTSVYGDVSWWTGTALFRTDIENNGGEFVGGEPLVCGNGLVQGGEGCDDGNLTDGDGCSATCDIEPGFGCDNEPGEPSVCALIPEGCSVNTVQIPDGDSAGASDSIVLPTGASLLDLDVSLEVSHTWVGDLIATLTHEDTGTSAIIIDRPGRITTGFGCDGNNIDATLDDEAASAVEDECANASVTIDGTFTPNNPLSVFDGEDAGGTWTLSISDEVNQDAGTLDGWCVLPTSGAADSDGDGVDDAADNCTNVANPDQIDADGDGYGNFCDADINNDCVVNAVDLGLLRTFFFGSDATADFNSDGNVNAVDLGIMRTLFFQPPGPGAGGSCETAATALN